MCFFFHNELAAMALSCVVETKLADLEVVMPQHYAVEIDLPDKIYQNFKTKYSKELARLNLPVIVGFEAVLRQSI